MKYDMILRGALIIISIAIIGCSNKPSSPPAQVAQSQSAKDTAKETAAPQPEATVQETPEPEGYVYQQRDRRDPFVPLIVPKKTMKKGEGVIVGTLESYDISEFTLAAIAKKGGRYYALITTPDNRSFTVNEGTVIGLYKGKVEGITKDKITIREYSRDYKGELKPRQFILEFHKGEVE